MKSMNESDYKTIMLLKKAVVLGYMTEQTKNQYVDRILYECGCRGIELKFLEKKI